MLKSIKNFTITKLHIKLNLPENEFQQWLTDLGMLHKKEHVFVVQKCVKRSITNTEDGGVKKCRKTKGALVWARFPG